MNIGQFCTCDVDNYGDLLYPVIFKKLLGKYGQNDGLSAYGFLTGPAPCGSNYDVNDINLVLKQGENKLTHLIVGGGDILRTDTMMMASHYNALYAERLKQSFVFRIKQRLVGPCDLGQLFKDRFMDYGAVGPFLLDKERYAGIGLLQYFSCGVPFAFQDPEKAGVRKAVESAAFVYVRDEQSRRKLVDAGVTREIAVAPDAIVCLSDFFNRTEEKLKGAEILRRHGINGNRDFICLQSDPQSPDDEKDLLVALSEIKRVSDADIVLMPIGFCHKDDVFLRHIAARSAGLCTYAEVHSIFDMISIIAASKAFVGTSMHGNITAFSFGIPHLFGPIAVDKAEGFLDIVGLGSDFKLSSWRDAPARLKMLQELPDNYFAHLAVNAKRAVYDVFDRMHALLSECHKR